MNGCNLKNGNLELHCKNDLRDLPDGVENRSPLIDLKLLRGNMNPLVRKEPVKKLENVTKIDLKEKDPFQRGLEHGRLLKREIQFIYPKILMFPKSDPKLQSEAQQFDKNIPKSIKEELKGLAEGSGYSYEEVLLVHTFLDSEVGLHGCSAMARIVDGYSDERIAATNHSLRTANNKQRDIEESETRKRRLLKARILDETSSFEALKCCNVMNTIQSIAFDLKERKIIVASNEAYAATSEVQRYSSSALFGEEKEKPPLSRKRVEIVRNLDWHYPFLGSKTIVLTRRHPSARTMVGVTFPGYIGTLSGMNDKGLALALCSSGEMMNPGGIPNPLLFTHLLDQCQNVKEASDFLAQHHHGSSVNLIIADQEEAKSLEFTGKENIIETVGTIGGER